MFEEILNKIDDVVWGIPTIALILVTGIVMTIATRGIQFTKFGRAFKETVNSFLCCGKTEPIIYIFPFCRIIK